MMKTRTHRATASFLVLLLLSLLILSSCNIGNKPFNLNADEIDEIEFGSNLGFFAPATYIKDDPEFFELIDLVNSFEYESYAGDPPREISAGRDVHVLFGEELRLDIGVVKSSPEGTWTDYTVLQNCSGKSYDGPFTLIAKDTEFSERLLEYGFPGWTLEKENADRKAEREATDRRFAAKGE